MFFYNIRVNYKNGNLSVLSYSYVESRASAMSSALGWITVDTNLHLSTLFKIILLSSRKHAAAKNGHGSSRHKWIFQSLSSEQPEISA